MPFNLGLGEGKLFTLVNARTSWNSKYYVTNKTKIVTNVNSKQNKIENTKQPILLVLYPKYFQRAILGGNVEIISVA